MQIPAHLITAVIEAAEDANRRSNEYVSPWGKPEDGLMLITRIWRKQVDRASAIRMQNT